jgi:hypothetical protein
VNEEATPRPWVAQSRDDGKSDPWWIDTHAYPDGPYPVWAPPQYPVSEADAALIVEAVNAYDRLRAVEEAARAYRAAFTSIHRIPIELDLSEAIDNERDALFAALEAVQ